MTDLPGVQFAIRKDALVVWFETKIQCASPLSDLRTCIVNSPHTCCAWKTVIFAIAFEQRCWFLWYLSNLPWYLNSRTYHLEVWPTLKKNFHSGHNFFGKTDRVLRTQELRVLVTYYRPFFVRLLTFSASSPCPLDWFWWNLVEAKCAWSLISALSFLPDPPLRGQK